MKTRIEYSKIIKHHVSTLEKTGHMLCRIKETFATFNRSSNNDQKTCSEIPDKKLGHMYEELTCRTHEELTYVFYE